eukprot:Em0003g792a
MTGHITAFSPLIEIAEEDQIEEVESYLRDKGATFPEATTAPSTLDRLLRIVDVSHVIFEDAKLPQNEVEGFFFSVVSFFHLLELEQKQPVVDKMCTKVMAGATTENGPFKLRILGLMFCHLKPTDPLCYLIFCHRLRLAKQLRLTSTALTMDLDKNKATEHVAKLVLEAPDRYKAPDPFARLQGPRPIQGSRPSISHSYMVSSGVVHSIGTFDQPGLVLKVNFDRTGGSVIVQVGGCEMVQVGGSEMVQVGGCEMVQVGGCGVTEMVQVGGSVIVQVGGCEMVQVGGSVIVQVGWQCDRAGGVTEMVQVGGSVIVQVGGCEMVQVGGSVIVQVGGCEMVQVGGSVIVQVGGSVIVQTYHPLEMWGGAGVEDRDTASGKGFRPLQVCCSLLLCLCYVFSGNGFGQSRSPLAKLKRWVDGWSLSQSDKRALYKLLWEAYEHVNLQLATKFLVELLKTYSASSAQEEEEPQRLVEHAIVLAIADGRQLVFDDLLTLPVVKAVQSKKIYQLFDIFVRERLSAFEKFYKENKSFVDDLGLKYDECVRKMRLLTLASLAEECRDIPFATLTAELNLPAEELEMFVVEAIGMRLIEARVNQVMQRVVITKSVYRTLTTDHWKLLHKRLSVWKQNIHAVKSSLNNFKSVQ